MCHLVRPASLHRRDIEDVELYHPHSWVTKYVFSQDAKVIAIQYSAHRPLRRADRPRAVMADAPAAGISRRLRLHRCQCLLPVHHHARHDDGGLCADRPVPRRIRQLPHPPDGRRPRHGVSLCQHAELLGLPARRAGARGELLRAGRPDRRRLDAVSAAGHPFRHARRSGMGHHPDARLPDDLHHRLYDGRPELRGDGASGARARHDPDAHAAHRLGHLHGKLHGASRLSGPVRRCRHDALRQDFRNQLLHAGHRRDGPASRAQRRQSAPVPASLLVLRPSGGLHRRPARLRHRLGSDQHPCAAQHLRLPHDGLGAARHRRPELRGLGAPHVCQRHEPLFRVLLRHHHADHRHPDRDQGL